MANKDFRPCAAWFVTLTYVPDLKWQPEHIADAIKEFRNWCRSNGF
jgi:hypothetical protein